MLAERGELCRQPSGDRRHHARRRRSQLHCAVLREGLLRLRAASPEGDRQLFARRQQRRIKDIQENTVDFGDSEIPDVPSALAAAKGGTVLQVPVELGGVAISYNVPGAPNGLRLDGPTLAAIFDGAITNWDSPVIAKVTGVSHLPNLAIVPVHRADSSGPGWDLDKYLISTSTNWVLKIGTSKASTSWPLPAFGEGEQLNTGVATFIKATPGAIGYVSFGYASKAGFTNVALENGSGGTSCRRPSRSARPERRRRT